MLFSQLSPETLRRLAKTASIRRFSDNQLLLNAGRRAEGFYIITSGRVRIFRSSENGRVQVLHIIEQGETVGEVPLFEGGCYPASAAAIGDTQAIYLDGEKFMDAAINNPQILLEMLAVLSGRLRRFVNLIDDLSLKDVSTRLRSYLCEKADRSDQVRLECSKADLADRLGTIPETLSRAFNKLKSENIIELKTTGEIKIAHP